MSVTVPSGTDFRALLAANEMLRGLGPDDLDEFLSLGRRVAFGTNQTIFAKGDPGDSLMVIAQGEVAIETFSEDGRTILLNLLRPGAVLGEIAALDGQERTAGARAITPTVAWRVRREDFLPFLERHPRLCLRLMEVLCGRLRWTSGIIEDTIFLVGQKRLASRLLKLGASHGRRRGAEIWLTQEFSQEELAQMLGTTRETVNRAMRALVEQRAVRYEQGLLVIADIALIQRISR